MTPIRLTTTNASDYEPLRYDGQRLDELWSELEETLTAVQNAPDFPAKERLTLAEPATGPGGQVDWYGPRTETPASPAQLQQQYQTLRTAIEVQLAKQPSTAKEALAQALNIPDATALYPGPSGPVLAPWGHRYREGKLAHGDLKYSENTAPPPVSPAPPAPRQYDEPPSTPVPAPAPLPEKPPVVATPPAIPSRRPLGPWPEWTFLLLGLLALGLFLWLLPHLAGLFVTFRMWCHASHLNLPWWILFLLGLLLLLLACFWPLRNRLMDLNDRRRARGIGASGGLLQVILVWNDRNDLDLHIVCPDKGRIYYDAPEHPDGARLEYDANADHSPLTARPVESVVWHHHARPGCYSVSVDPYNMRVAKTSAFRVCVIYKGRVILRRRGVARENQRYGAVCNFTIPAS